MGTPVPRDWLSNEKDQFDHIIVLKIDRIARSVRHLSDIIEWRGERQGPHLL